MQVWGTGKGQHVWFNWPAAAHCMVGCRLNVRSQVGGASSSHCTVEGADSASSCCAEFKLVEVGVVSPSNCWCEVGGAACWWEVGGAVSCCRGSLPVLEEGVSVACSSCVPVCSLPVADGCGVPTTFLGGITLWKASSQSLQDEYWSRISNTATRSEKKKKKGANRHYSLATNMLMPQQK